MSEPSLYICDNCGTENPPLKEGDTRITACCGQGFTGFWKDGWGKRMHVIGQKNIDFWRARRKELEEAGELPLKYWSQQGHYEI